ncbi:MAG: metallophosphoesterase [Verrucomicrobiae bacterium]
MRILLTADLHRDEAKLRWLIESAPAHDAVLVAGDLLDIFSNAGFMEQKSRIIRWKSSVLARDRALAWCSGNHDFFHGDHTPMSAASPLWMRESPPTKMFVPDGESRLIETPGGRLAVTTLPWPVGGDDLVINGYRTTFVDFATNLLMIGKKLQEEESVPWIVLCHEPPGETPLAATYIAREADLARMMIEAAAPDFSLHGHIHQAPTSPGGLWIWQIGKTVSFNPGQSAAGEAPHFILLEWRAPGDCTATWNGAGRVIRAEVKPGGAARPSCESEVGEDDFLDE